MGDKAQPATLARVACSKIFSVPLSLHIVFAQGGGKPNDESESPSSATCAGTPTHSGCSGNYELIMN